jgi:nudix-type nucleoside diphosphatase (YffH/AdpP family)
MKRKIETITEKRVYDGYLKIDEAVINDTDESGKSVQYERFKLARPDAVAIVVYNESEDKVILTRQHRYPIDDKVDGNILEIPAGKIDGDEDPKEAAIREIEEEIGFKVQEGKIGLLNSFFASPGYSNEKIYLFLAFVNNEDRVSEGGGLEGEHENIEVEPYGVSEFFDMVADGTIVDGKTLMGAQALWHFRNSEVVAAGRQFIEEKRMARATQIVDQVINEDPETNADADEAS